MSSSGKKKKLTMKHPRVVSLGCGCRRAKLSSLFSSSGASQVKSKAKPHSAPSHRHPLSSYYPFSPSTATAATSPWETSRHPSSASTATTTSLYGEDPPSSSPPPRAAWGPASSRREPKRAPPPERKGKRPQASSGGRVRESVAVEKESDDPYVDFRNSMLQMILEKEIYAWDDLRELLGRFLALNAPHHHDTIVRAFAEIWNVVFSSSPSSSSTAAAAATPGSSSCAAAAGATHGGGRRRHSRASRDA